MYAIRSYYALLSIMGLNEGAITPTYRYFGGPAFQIPGTARKFRDWRRGGHGWLDVYRAIEVSAETFFYDLAYRVGIDKIHEYMSKVGFGNYSGLDLYEESTGVLPSRRITSYNVCYTKLLRRMGR